MTEDIPTITSQYKDFYSKLAFSDKIRTKEVNTKLGLKLQQMAREGQREVNDHIFELNQLNRPELIK